MSNARNNNTNNNTNNGNNNNNNRAQTPVVNRNISASYTNDGTAASTTPPQSSSHNTGDGNRTKEPLRRHKFNRNHKARVHSRRPNPPIMPVPPPQPSAVPSTRISGTEKEKEKEKEKEREEEEEEVDGGIATVWEVPPWQQRQRIDTIQLALESSLTLQAQHDAMVDNMRCIITSYREHWESLLQIDVAEDIDLYFFKTQVEPSIHIVPLFIAKTILYLGCISLGDMFNGRVCYEEAAALIEQILKITDNLCVVKPLFIFAYFADLFVGQIDAALACRCTITALRLCDTLKLSTSTRQYGIILYCWLVILHTHRNSSKTFSVPKYTPTTTSAPSIEIKYTHPSLDYVIHQLHDKGLEPIPIQFESDPHIKYHTLETRYKWLRLYPSGYHSLATLMDLAIDSLRILFPAALVGIEKEPYSADDRHVLLEHIASAYTMTSRLDIGPCALSIVGSKLLGLQLLLSGSDKNAMSLFESSDNAGRPTITNAQRITTQLYISECLETMRGPSTGDISRPLVIGHLIADIDIMLDTLWHASPVLPPAAIKLQTIVRSTLSLFPLACTTNFRRKWAPRFGSPTPELVMVV